MKSAQITRGDFPPHYTYRRPLHYNCSTCGIPPHEYGMAIENISYFNAYPPPLYFFANSSNVNEAYYFTCL